MMLRGGIGKRFLEERMRRGPILRRLRDRFFRASTMILDPDQTWVQLRKDFEKSEFIVLMISPFLSRQMVKKFLDFSEVKSALERGVNVKVLTKPSKEIKNSKEHQNCIQMLEENDIHVEPIDRLHFKAAFLDDEGSLSIAYIGSVNLLSVITVKGVPEDYMLRFESEALIDELASQLKGLKLYKHLGLE